MNWLRDKLRAWLGIETNTAGLIEAAQAPLEYQVVSLRIELDALKGEVRAREPQPQQVSFRINVDDYESSQLKALAEFIEEKK